MMLGTESVNMTEERSLLTNREREILSGEADVSDNYRYKVESVARRRVRNVEDDVEVLRENYPEIFEELQEIVCSDEEGRD
jgi:hypothetical protein